MFVQPEVLPANDPFVRKAAWEIDQMLAHVEKDSTIIIIVIIETSGLTPPWRARREAAPRSSRLGARPGLRPDGPYGPGPVYVRPLGALLARLRLARRVSGTSQSVLGKGLRRCAGATGKARGKVSGCCTGIPRLDRWGNA